MLLLSAFLGHNAGLLFYIICVCVLILYYYIIITISTAITALLFDVDTISPSV